MKKSLIATIVSSVLLTSACATLDEAMGASNLHGDTTGMSCEDMAKRYTEIANSQRRVQAAARLTGGDTYEIRQQYAEVLTQVRDAQIAAGCL